MDRQRPLRLTRIRVYPLKGAGGCDLGETGLDAFGIPGDRRWMLAKSGGQFISQRTHPRLCLVHTAPVAPDPGGAGRTPDKSYLKQPPEIEEMRFKLEAPGMDPFDLMPAPSDVWVEVQVHGDRFSALAGYDEANRWFSDFLGERCQVVFIPDEVRRPVDPEFASGHRVSLADGYPLHLTTEESLREVNQALSRETTMLSYRPNLVLAGGVPWEEDEWRVLEIGGVRVRPVKPCARCAVITVNQGTGVRDQESLRSLRGFREWEGKVYFGQNAVFQGTGRFRVGENVHILERGSRRPPLSA
jgi:uncharacterized protein YcbX